MILFACKFICLFFPPNRLGSNTRQVYWTINMLSNEYMIYLYFTLPLDKQPIYQVMFKVDFFNWHLHNDSKFDIIDIEPLKTMFDSTNVLIYVLNRGCTYFVQVNSLCIVFFCYPSYLVISGLQIWCDYNVLCSFNKY